MNQDFDFAVAQTITDIALSTASSYFEPIVGEVEKIKAGYGKLLRATAIGRDQAPDFGGADLGWVDLTDAWMRRKKTYPRPAFYKGLSTDSNSLSADLFKLPGERLFGKTTLRTRIQQVETEGFYNPRIKRQINTVYRDDRGRFMRANEEARRTVLVVVNPFPNVDRDEEDMIRRLPIGEKNKIKLFANAEKRPIIGPYTEWFFENRLRAKIIAMSQGLNK